MAYVRSQRQYRVLSEDRHRFVVTLLTRDINNFDPKINEFQELTVKHFCVKFGDPSCIVFLRYRAKEYKKGENSISTTAVGMDKNYEKCYIN